VSRWPTTFVPLLLSLFRSLFFCSFPPLPSLFLRFRVHSPASCFLGFGPSFALCFCPLLSAHTSHLKGALFWSNLILLGTRGISRGQGRTCITHICPLQGFGRSGTPAGSFLPRAPETQLSLIWHTSKPYVCLRSSPARRLPHAGPGRLPMPCLSFPPFLASERLGCSICFVRPPLLVLLLQRSLRFHTMSFCRIQFLESHFPSPLASPPWLLCRPCY